MRSLMKITSSSVEGDSGDVEADEEEEGSPRYERCKGSQEEVRTS